MGARFACARTSNHAVVAGHPEGASRPPGSRVPPRRRRAEATCQCQATESGGPSMWSKSPLIPGADARLAPAAARGFLFNRSSRQVRAF